MIDWRKFNGSFEMKYIIIIGLMVHISFEIKANDVYKDGLFTQQARTLNFDSESKLAEHIKSNMPSTYLYYDRLTTMAKKRVFEHHKENLNKDITEIVLIEYRNRS